MAEISDAAAIIDSTRALTLAAEGPKRLAGAEHVVSMVIPNNFAHVLTDLEQYADHPRRKKAHTHFTTTESLAAYVVRHATAGTTLYADGETKVEAILNDHSAGEPGHRDHRATLNLVRTPGCERWIKAHARYMGQEEFSQLIEDGLTEIARPDGAELLEVAQSITATKNASFRSDRRLDSGRVQFTWHEEFDASAGQNGELTIPNTITLVFAPFYGAAPIQLDARFRYRLNDGKLTLGFWLIRHEEALREAFAAEMARLEALVSSAGDEPGAEALTVLWGAP